MIFYCVNDSHPSALDNLIQLYIGRSFHTWKDPDLLPWLERNAHSCMDDMDADACVTSDYDEKRNVRYQGTPRNVFRHIILSDIKDATAALPRVKMLYHYLSSSILVITYI